MLGSLMLINPTKLLSLSNDQLRLKVLTNQGKLHGSANDPLTSVYIFCLIFRMKSNGVQVHKDLTVSKALIMR